MEGVILFADDHVLENEFEKGLFEALSKEKKHPVLPIVNLDLLESSIISTSSIKALIVDWNFENYDTEMKAAGVPMENETPYSKLMSLEIFSLIYIYSEKAGLEYTEQGIKLKERFKEKIHFRQKDKSGDIKAKTIAEKDLILEDLNAMSMQLGNIQLPIQWTQVINQSVQGIFLQLNSIDKKWISDLYKTAEDDGVEPSVEVINLFQNLLAEKVIQSKKLRDSIKKASVIIDGVTEPEQYAKLFRTFLYSYIDAVNDPIMTGDIFKLESNKYGILITPECDIRKVQKKEENEFEFIVFNDSNKIDEMFFTRQFKDSKDTIKEAIKSLGQDEKNKVDQALSELKTELLKSAFTQPHPRVYILPCFEFVKDNYQTKTFIDFSTSLEFKKVKDAKPTDRICKFNSPYIQDLRQRFLAYKGRVGVPSFPDNLRSWLLNG